MLGEALPKSEELIKATFQALVGDKFSEKSWRRTIHDGLLADSAWPDEAVPDASGGGLPTDLSAGMPPNGQFELVFLRDPSVYDGRFANNAWLQECPDPLTKLTWDNAAVMSPATAKALGCLRRIGREAAGGCTRAWKWRSTRCRGGPTG